MCISLLRVDVFPLLVAALFAPVYEYPNYIIGPRSDVDAG